MPRRDFRDARCLVTGASSGLGRAIATKLAERGASVVLTGRSAQRLEQAGAELNSLDGRSGQALTVAADLTDPADRRRLFEVVSDRFGGALDLVVNSAGVGAYGRFESHDESVLRRVMEINLFALRVGLESRRRDRCVRRSDQSVSVPWDGKHDAPIARMRHHDRSVPRQEFLG